MGCARKCCRGPVATGLVRFAGAPAVFVAGDLSTVAIRTYAALCPLPRHHVLLISGVHLFNEGEGVIGIAFVVM